MGPPSHGEDPARQIDVQVSAVAAAHVPDRGPLERPQFAREGESLVPRHRRPRDGVEVAALVLELADHLARARVEHPERRMQEVAVLGVLDAHEGAVGGEPAAEPRLQRPHPGRGLVVCEDPGGAVPLDQVGPVGAADLHRDRRDPGFERVPHEPPFRQRREDGLGPASRERHRHQQAALVPGRVAPPRDPVAGKHPGHLHPDRFIAHLPPRAVGQVVGPRLVTAAAVGHDREVVGRAVVPRGEADLGRGEATHPVGLFGHGAHPTCPLRRLATWSLPGLPSLALTPIEC